jgi:glycosyltransferase involved in cell wall biosynthesis
MSERPLISIVIPSRNEAKDIKRTIEACLAINYEPKEIIVVDDSTDCTPQIVASYASRGVRLIHRKQNRNGCCGARNLGMKLAQGEIIVLLNADNVPRPDFLDRLLSHYQEGADYVVIRSVVLNRDNPYGKFIWAQGIAWLSTEPCMEWSEGFSCRRAAAQAVGYIPGDFPVPFCRDWRLGAALNQAGFRKHVDLNIEMEHVVPCNLREFWHNRVWRGSMTPLAKFYFDRLSVRSVVIREILRASRTLLKILSIAPVLWQAIRYSAYISGGWRDILSLFFVAIIQELALMVGAFKGVKLLIKTEGWRRRSSGTE